MRTQRNRADDVIVETRGGEADFWERDQRTLMNMMLEVKNVCNMKIYVCKEVCVLTVP